MVTAGGVCAALEGELGRWLQIDAEPALYTLHYMPPDGAALRRWTPPGAWPEGEPLEHLPRIAGAVRPAEAVTPDFLGFAFRAETGEGATGVQRWIWALTGDRESYAAVKMLHAPGMASGANFTAPEPVRLTLEWLLQQLPRRAVTR